jgi:hypothetical protein
MAGGRAGAALEMPAPIPVAVPPSAAAIVAPATSRFIFMFMVRHLSCGYRYSFRLTPEVSWLIYDSPVEPLVMSRAESVYYPVQPVRDSRTLVRQATNIQLRRP